MKTKHYLNPEDRKGQRAAGRRAGIGNCVGKKKGRPGHGRRRGGEGKIGDGTRISVAQRRKGKGGCDPRLCAAAGREGGSCGGTVGWAVLAWSNTITFQEKREA